MRPLKKWLYIACLVFIQLYARQIICAEPELDGEVLTRKLEALSNVVGDEIDLFEAMLIIGKIDDQNIDAEKHRAKFRSIVGAIRDRLKVCATNESRLRKISDYLFNEVMMQSPERMGIDTITTQSISTLLKEKKGACLTLSAYFLCVAQQLGVKVELVVLPNHAFLMLNDGTEDLSVETTSNGRVLVGSQGIRSAFEKIVKYPIHESLIRKLQKKEILAYLIANEGLVCLLQENTAMAKRLLKASQAFPETLLSRYLEYSIAKEEGKMEECKKLVAELVEKYSALGSGQALLFAAQMDDVNKIQLLLDHGMHVDSRDILGNSALHFATSKQVVRVLVERGLNIESTNGSNQTPLHFACMHRESLIVDELLRLGANASASSSNRMTPLHYAAEAGNPEAVTAMLKKGVDINTCDIEGRTPLYCTILHNKEGVASILIDAGADSSVKNDDGETALHLAASKGMEDIVKRLLEAGAKGDWLTHEGDTVLHSAVCSDNPTLIEMFVKFGVKIDIKNKSGQTPLVKAIFANALHSVRKLLELGADKKVKFGGVGLLQVAAMLGRANIANELLLNGFDPNEEIPDGKTPLHLLGATNIEKKSMNLPEWKLKALERKGLPEKAKVFFDSDPVAVARILLDKGAKISKVDQGGNTPLHIAAQSGYLNIASFLLDKGCEIDQSNAVGSTPLHLAAEAGRNEVVSFLLQKGASISGKSRFGFTPLHAAANLNHLDTVRLLIGAGANPLAKDIDGKMPIDYAHAREIVDFLKGITSKTQPEK